MQARFRTAFGGQGSKRGVSGGRQRSTFGHGWLVRGTCDDVIELCVLFHVRHISLFLTSLEREQEEGTGDH